MLTQGSSVGWPAAHSTGIEKQFSEVVTARQDCITVIGEGVGSVSVEPAIVANVTFLHTDGVSLVGRLVGILHPVLNAGPLRSGLQDHQLTSVHSKERDNNSVVIRLLQSMSMFDPSMEATFTP